MKLGPGSLIGTNIVLERELGHGAMGTVWVAENRSLGAKVAVKVLPFAMSDSEEALHRFEQEAKTAAQIDSPHVVKTFDFGMTSDEQPYIVMELLRGRDLREEIQEQGNLPPQKVAIIVRQLCRALSSAHALGLVHRDIKPANIFLLDSGGGEPFVKVLDFGISRFISDQNMGMTETGAVMGTPYYMSPEQFVDPRRIDHRSDLWSAAVVLYGCLIGSLPFLGETVGALSLAVHMGTFVPPTQALPGLPVALDAFFTRALQVDPNLRYASADELATAFEAATQSVASSAFGGPPSSAQVTAHAHTPGAYAPSYGAPVSTLSDAAAQHAPSHGAPQPYAMPAGATQPETAPSGSWTPPGQAGPSAATHAPTPASFAQTTPPAKPASSSKGLWIGVVLAVFGLGALAMALVVPSLLSKETQDKRSELVEDDTRAAAETGKKKKKKKKKKKDDDDDEEAAAPEPTAAPAPTETPTAEPTVAPAAEPSAPPSAPAPTPIAPPPPAAPKPAPAPTQPKWRPLKMTCAKFDKSKSCSACCPKGDIIMKPYPSCECFFDGEKWDREHGKAP